MGIGAVWIGCNVVIDDIGTGGRGTGGKVA